MAEHGKKCECPACIPHRVQEYLARIHDESRLIPEAANQTVPVRAHWRRHPGHLKKQPKFKSALVQALHDLRFKDKERK